MDDDVLDPDPDGNIVEETDEIAGEEQETLPEIPADVTPECVEAAEEGEEQEMLPGIPAGSILDSRLESIIESVLFAAGAPVGLQRLTEVLNGPPPREVKRAIESLTAHYDTHERGIRLMAVAGGYQFRTAPENNEWVRALLRERPVRLGRAALETLAVIAYKQPVTRAEIEAVRGVDADSSVSSLLSKRLIKIAGRKETVGRPLVYATTPEFLEVFGLKDLKDLPALKEIGPAPENDDDAATDDFDQPGTLAEAPEPGGDQLAPESGEPDPGGEGASERPSGDGAGDEGGPETGSNHS